MNGHTTQLGPHIEESQPRKSKKNHGPFVEFKESREHILILLILLFFSANVALIFIHYSSPSPILDSPSPQGSMAAIGSTFLNFLSL